MFHKQAKINVFGRFPQRQRSKNKQSHRETESKRYIYTNDVYQKERREINNVRKILNSGKMM